MKTGFGTLLCGAILAATGCHLTGGHNLPPATQLAHPGPGVSGPGPGVLTPPQAAMVYGPALTAGPQSVQVLFAKPEAMQVFWDVSGTGVFDSVPLVVPGRRNFGRGGIYRLKLTNIEGREGVELYPTLEIGPTTPRIEAFLAHNAIPIQFTEEDLDQVLSGNFVTKVIYLPDPEFQELALAGVETLVSTRLDPGVDPIVEADRRGSILAVVRLGNKDMEMPQGEFEEGTVMPASFSTAVGCPEGAVGGPDGGGMAYGPGGMPPGLVSGVTAPQYGMTMSGTPIGLPGPPHIPLGVPAGLQKHVMHNHTKMHLPDPTSQVKINVKQRPGYSYPQPASKAWIVEDTIHSAPHYSYKHFGSPPTGHQHYVGQACPTCGP
jgi:hypothetical protein